MKPRGSNWRHGRARLDLSAETAAERLHISPQYLRNIESNQERATPSGRLVYRAAALYDVTFDDLVDSDDGEKDKPAEDTPKTERAPDPSGPPARRGKDPKAPPRSDMKAAS